MREWISNRSEEADEQVGETALFAAIRISLEAVDSQNRRAAVPEQTEDRLRELRAVRS